VTDLAYARAYEQSEALWKRLGGPWTVRNDNQLVDHPLLNEILAVTRSGPQAPDYGIASAWRTGLVNAGFLTVRRLDNGDIEYRKAEKCPEPDKRTFMEKEQERIDAQVALERRLRKEEEDARERAARFHGPSLAQQIPEYVKQRVEEAVAPLRAGLEQLTAELAAMRHTGGNATTVANDNARKSAPNEARRGVLRRARRRAEGETSK
jgi:hypothetical protein